MLPLPTQNLRSNLATWAVPPALAPAVAAAMVDALPLEPFDPGFRGQCLATTYFDTRRLTLVRARRQGTRYLTLRIRCYRPAGEDGPEAYAFSAKSEEHKVRVELARATADLLRHGIANPALQLAGILPGDLLARLLALTADEPLLPSVTVSSRRYAVEDDTDRLTLDLAVNTDTGKRLPAGVLEFKSTVGEAAPPDGVARLELRPIKLSKFLWALDWRA